MNVPEVGVTPNCPKCGKGNTWGKHRLSREYEHPEANAFCKNCRTEFFVPPDWDIIDDWEEQVEVF